jgi:hypothetical protein
VVLGRNYTGNNVYNQLNGGTINGQLAHPIQVAGQGLERGFFPWISTTQTIGTFAISGVPGTWKQLRFSHISLTIEELDGFADTLVNAVPAASLSQYGVQWSARDDLQMTRWELSNPDSSVASDQEIFLVGILLGIWGGGVIALGQWAFTRLVKADPERMWPT